MKYVEFLLYSIVPYVVDIYIRNLIDSITLQYLRRIYIVSFVIVPYTLHIYIRTLISSIIVHHLHRSYTHLCYSTVYCKYINT